MIKFAREPFDWVIEEIQPLLFKHWQEIATYDDIMLDPNLEGYRMAEKRDALRIYTARNEADGVLVGYGVFFIGNMHYQSGGIATQDILFLKPEYRCGRTGIRLIQFCDSQLAGEGRKVVYQHVKLEHDFGPVLRRLGYKPVETIWARRL